MAGKIALMYRREEARNRLTTALDGLMDRLGIDDLSIPMIGKDPDLLAVQQIEAMADVAEAVGNKLGEPLDVDGELVAGTFTLDIDAAYAAYDADPRVHGPEDFDAFRDAVEGMFALPPIEGDEAALDGTDDDHDPADDTADPDTPAASPDGDGNAVPEGEDAAAEPTQTESEAAEPDTAPGANGRARTSGKRGASK